MRASTRWFTAALFILALMAIGCASGGLPPIDLSKLPPIVIAPAPSAPTENPPKTEAAKPRATLAFHVLNLTGDELDTAIATVKKDGADIDAKQARANGYIRFDGLEAAGAFYDVTFDADGYKTITRKVQLGSKADTADGEGNRQFDIILSREAEPIVPKPIQSEPPVVIAPPKVEEPTRPTGPQVTPLEEAAGWSDEQWRAFIMPLLKKTGELVNEANLKIVRPELVARGADFQNGWRGDMRARVFLPVPGCASSAIKPDPLPCAYNRTFDLGLVGEAWQWIKR